MTPQPMTLRRPPEPHARERVAKLLDATARHCHAVAPARVNIRHAEERIEQARHARLELPRHALLWTIMAILLLAGAFWVDTLIAGSLISYLAKDRLQLSSAEELWVQRLGALVILAMEIPIALMLHHTRREAIPGEKTPLTWKILGVLMVAGMTATAIAGALANSKGAPDALFYWKTAVLVAFTLAAHAAVIGGGWLFETAWHNVETLCQLGYANRSANQAHAEESSAVHGARRGFEGYYNERAGYIARYPRFPIEPGPFDVITAQVLREIYGRPVVNNGEPEPPPALPIGLGAPAAPNAGRGAPAAPAPAEPQAPEEQHTADENAYLRNALDALVRNRDGELGPAPIPGQPNAGQPNAGEGAQR